MKMIPGAKAASTRTGRSNPKNAWLLLTFGPCLDRFSHFFQSTPQDLIDDGLYKTIALALHPMPHREVSMAQVAQACGAMPSKKKRAKAAKAADQMQRCPLPQQYDEHRAAQAMRALLAEGLLDDWCVGAKRGRISSQFTTSTGAVDTLTAIHASDRDYGNLLAAHVSRAYELLAQ